MRISRAVWWMGLSALGSLVASPSAAQYRYRQPVDDEMIQSVMPAADSFSAKGGLPPVYTAYGPRLDGSPRSVVGYVYLTSNVPPAEYGYSSRIDVLVGMDLVGEITGVSIVDYSESLSSSRGDFLRGAGLEEQVLGKHIAEWFQVGRDLQGVSGASISSRAMFRSIRNSARRVALAYLQENESYAPETDAALEDLTWMQMVSTGYIRTMAIERASAVGLELSFAYMGDEALGGLLMGVVRYQDVAARVAGLIDDDHAMFVGIDGSAVAGFRTNGLSVRQGEEVYPVPSRQVTFLGIPWEGKAAEQVVYTLIMRMDSAVDLEQPFTVVYQDGTGGPFTADYAIPGEVLASVRERAAVRLAAAESTAVEPADSESAVAEAAVPGGGSASVPEPATATAPASTDSVATEEAATERAAVEPTGASSQPDELIVLERALDLTSDRQLEGASTGLPALQDTPALDFSSFEDFEDETALSRLLLETRWAPVVRLIFLLALVLYAFFAKKEWVRGVTLATTLIYLGFFDGGFLSVSHIASGFAVGPAFYIRDMALLVMVGFTVITTLLWGRVFCGFLCSFGVLQDLITHLVPRRL